MSDETDGSSCVSLTPSLAARVIKKPNNLIILFPVIKTQLVMDATLSYTTGLITDEVN